MLYYSMNAAEFASFVILASKWRKLMQQWQIVESNLSQFCTERFKRFFVIKIRLITLTVLLLALGTFVY